MSTDTRAPALTGMTRAALAAWCDAHDVPSFRATQIWQWLYRHAVTRYEDMTNVPQTVRAQLATDMPLCSSYIAQTYTADDTSVKYLVTLADGLSVECVWIPMGSHGTVCVSTQAGCPVGCVFCASGAEGSVRNLASYEIVEQVLHMCRLHGRDAITNCVFMGTGEPFYNTDALFAAAEILNDAHGICMGMRRMTVSTVGVLSGIARQAQDAPQMNLAVSLHAADDALRAQLISRCPSRLDALHDALEAYYRATHRRITFEYVLIRGINDRLSDARALAAYAKKLPSKVNLIPCNPVPGLPYRPPSAAACEAFCDEINAHHVTALLRRRKGDDISAACGQLRSYHTDTHPLTTHT